MNDPRLTPLLLGLLLLMTACAEMRNPPGGPEDKFPPEILSVDPLPGSIQVDTSVAVHVVFSEDISTATLKQAFGVSPPPPGTVRADWKGTDEVTIRFDPPLKDDRTYVITLGTQLSDDRRNTLEETYVIAFSTGDSLDTGRMRGVLTGLEDPSGWTIAGYYLGARKDVTQERIDTTLAAKGPNPSADPPDATTQTGKTGDWRLTHMRQGWWRVYAFRDQDADRLWTPWLEQVAVPSFDVYVDDDSTRTSRQVFLKPQQPNSLPQVSRVMARLKTQFWIRFDRTLPNLDVRFSLVEPPPRTEVEMREEGEEETPREWRIVPTSYKIGAERVGFVPGDSSTVAVQWEKPVLGELIGLRVLGSFGYSDTLDTTLTVDLAKTAVSDTIPPALIRVVPEEKNRLHSGRNRVQWIFTEPVSLHPDSGFWWRPAEDTLRPVLEQPEANRIAFSIPDSTAGGPMRFELLGRFLADREGNTLSDSSLTWVYTWLPADSLGTITGTVVSPLEGTVHLRFHEVFGTQLPLDLTLSSSGEYTLTKVPAGSWSASGWQDADGSNAWTAGRPYPFLASDPIVVTRDTVDVRARWETGKVEIIFP